MPIPAPRPQAKTGAAGAGDEAALPRGEQAGPAAPRAMNRLPASGKGAYYVLATERDMKAKLLIVTDLGLLKAYELEAREGASPRITLREQSAFAPAHQHVTDQVTDSAGRRAAPGSKGGGTMADSHNLELEVRRRLVKQLAQKIEALAPPAPELVGLAAPKDLLRPITESLPPALRARLEKQVALDLTKLEPKEVVARFLAS
jgi:hypothetical protein